MNSDEVVLNSLEMMDVFFNLAKPVEPLSIFGMQYTRSGLQTRMSPSAYEIHDKQECSLRIISRNLFLMLQNAFLLLSTVVLLIVFYYNLFNEICSNFFPIPRVAFSRSRITHELHITHVIHSRNTWWNAKRTSAVTWHSV